MDDGGRRSHPHVQFPEHVVVDEKDGNIFVSAGLARRRVHLPKEVNGRSLSRGLRIPLVEASRRGFWFGWMDIARARGRVYPRGCLLGDWRFGLSRACLGGLFGTGLGGPRQGPRGEQKHAAHHDQQIPTQPNGISHRKMPPGVMVRRTGPPQLGALSLTDDSHLAGAKLQVCSSAGLPRGAIQPTPAGDKWFSAYPNNSRKRARACSSSTSGIASSPTTPWYPTSRRASATLG